jgi:1,4-alpha-glucan branching enzyme
MVSLLTTEKLLEKTAESRWLHQDDKIIMYNKGDVIFAFNFHPTKSFDGYFVPVLEEGDYEVILSTDDSVFGGYDRVDKEYVYKAEKTPGDWKGFKCYLPSRSAIVFKKV